MVATDTLSLNTLASDHLPPLKAVNEFHDGRKRPPYTWQASLRDWFRQAWSSDYSDEQVEHRLLSYLPFYPEPDERRRARFINTDVGDGKYIHEFLIENTEPENPNNTLTPLGCKDIVIMHGYAASLGLFLDNFDQLSAIPGTRIHAIDILGFGFSARPPFPRYDNKTVADIRQNEDWFIDLFEQWRRRRGIDRFVLVGHSFGGYLSCAYTMKYQPQAAKEGRGVEKLVLLSPVGIERHNKSLLKDAKLPAEQINGTAKALEDKQHPEVRLSQEIAANQEDIVRGEAPEGKLLMPVQQRPDGEAKTGFFSTKVFPWLWEKHVSPFSIVRKLGPARSKMMSGWTTHRFSHIYYQDPKRFQVLHDYYYRIFNADGSGEYAITRILAVGALARLPLLDRCPVLFSSLGLPTLWLYGDKDWMSKEAGHEMVLEINRLAKAEGKGRLASFRILDNAGHHMYLDNPDQFAETLFDFMRA